MRFIALQNRDGDIVALTAVSDIDFDALNRFVWRYQAPRGRHVTGYAVRNERVRPRPYPIKTHYMHRVIFGDVSGVVDHIDGNGLNNVRDNLRSCSVAQNNINTAKSRKSASPYKGIHFRSDCNRWRALIQVNGRRTHLGYFATAQEAREAYRSAAAQLHGVYAREGRLP